MKIAILLYENMTALDAVGPYEVLSRFPGVEVCFVAENAGPIVTDTGFLTLTARAGIQDVSEADILLVPGGPGDQAVRKNEKLLDWIRQIHQTSRFTTSVCSGSLILGIAGILKGLRATSHWTQLETLREYGAEPTLERVVEQGKVITAAGVSSGIDMGLRLLQILGGDDLAKAIQLGIEYDPEPPFDVGSPSKAPKAIVDLVRQSMAY